MRTLKRLAHAIQQPALEHEQAAAEEYERQIADQHAAAMGFSEPAEDRLAAHRRATAGAPRIRVTRAK